MKKIYFVRHGESESNIGIEASHDNSSLTTTGRKQAELLADRVSKLNIDIVISSPLIRAKDTATIIANTLGKNVEILESLFERRRSSKHVGKPEKDPEFIDYVRNFMKNFGDPNFKYEDEESYEELKNRAEEVIRVLESRPEENILVVTHGFFMRMIVASAIFGKDITPDVGKKFALALHTGNTGVTVLINDEKNFHPWCLWTWNDLAHLEDLD